MAITLDTPLSVILDDPKAKAVMDQYLPGVSSNPMIAMARGMTIKMILAMPQAKQFGFTQEKAEQILKEINKQIK